MNNKSSKIARYKLDDPFNFVFLNVSLVYIIECNFKTCIIC